MLMVISPAKSLDYTSEYPNYPATEPRQLPQSQALVDILANYTPAELGSLMKISDKLADLNAGRFQSWQLPMQAPEAKPCIYAFTGDTYVGLAINEQSQATVERLQERLRILSGLYGLLRPLDLMLPYRLEMGTRLANPKGKNLYEFWGDSITALLNQDLAEQGSHTLLNLASNEYFKAINPKSLKAQVVTPVFQDEKNGQYKVISFHAKKARGAMAAWVAQQGIEKVEDLAQFNWQGYAFVPELSTKEAPLFRRPEAV